MKWLESLEARWQAWWPELEPREQRMILAAAVLIALALAWWVALAPALRTLSSAPAEHARLDAQLQQMTALQSQARALQSQPRANRDDAMRALEATVRQNLGPNAQLQSAGAGENVTIAVRSAPADALAELLTQARSNARAVPREVHLTRSAQQTAAAPAAASGPTRVRWDGTLVMGLPAR
ncbi:type II secretion system protein GspM [Variovorax saccharolyticus]|uniref:type II secretion system protein GspM n=1 Tax=Variovorax saccharolyticus TaxID=3053516 RepID=UPI002576E7A1|nr:type II secretion system protein GspM [Variovorax sp. J22R187]MDM0017875.1 type II secretion system protein GspM [Variovorax sp. J22R187]